jgi:hypothetical protein
MSGARPIDWSHAARRLVDGGSMLDGLSRTRLSRRRTVQAFVALAASAMVPLGSIANAQSTSENQPTTPPANNNRPNTRFTNNPPPPPPNPPAPAPVITSPFTVNPASNGPTPNGQPNAGSTAPGNAPAAAPSPNDAWVQNTRETELWSGPDDKAISFGLAPALSYFQVLAPQDGARIRVRNPLGGTAYITAKDVGPSGPPPAWYLAQANQVELPARIIGGANVRSTPGVADNNLVTQLGHNAPITIIGEVVGTDSETWYRIGQREFVHNSLVRKPSPFKAHPGNVIVAELTEPCIVTAYENAKPVFSTLSLKGTTSWGTPTGFFTILRRVQNETMSSETLGIPRDGPGGYYLKDVLYTQYFTNDGASIHYNYWSSNWGYSGSHGCLGMSYDDALWFWNWAEVGTALFIQE